LTLLTSSFSRTKKLFKFVKILIIAIVISIAVPHVLKTYNGHYIQKLSVVVDEARERSILKTIQDAIN
jgi:hypothetical protein